MADGKTEEGPVFGLFMVNMPSCLACLGWVVTRSVEATTVIGGATMRVPIDDIMAQVTVDDLITERTVRTIIAEIPGPLGARKVPLLKTMLRVELQDQVAASEALGLQGAVTVNKLTLKSA